MPRFRLALALLLLGTAFAAGADEPLPHIRSGDFPSVSKRAAFFEERVNAAEAEVRKRLLLEVGYFFDIPDPEYTAFLRRMMRDPDPAVRGRAILKLHDLWVPVEVKDLPQTFAGYHDGQLIDREDTRTVPGLVAACHARSAEAGYAAYVLGLLRHKAAVPELRKLAAHENIFVRYAAARALLDCGDKEGARPILEKVIRSQLALYASPAVDPEGREPYYAAVSCRAFMELGSAEKKVGLEKLIALAGYLERSAGVNDQAHLPAVRQLLAAVTGRYFLSGAEARKWYEQEYGRPGVGVLPPP